MCESISPTVEFISLAKEFRHEYVVEKSRFITTIYPCHRRGGATFINRINKEFWDAATTVHGLCIRTKARATTLFLTMVSLLVPLVNHVRSTQKQVLPM